MEPRSPRTQKFTFENFVYGPENSHAYRSALKFAALADERGTCTSLFIYGKSGLGKTHLLLAIQKRARREVARDQGQVCQLPGISWTT